MKPSSQVKKSSRADPRALFVNHPGLKVFLFFGGRKILRGKMNTFSDILFLVKFLNRRTYDMKAFYPFFSRGSEPRMVKSANLLAPKVLLEDRWPMMTIPSDITVCPSMPGEEQYDSRRIRTTANELR